MDFRKEIAALLDAALQKEFGQSLDGLAQMLEQPPNPDLGDYAFPCFKLAKTLRKAPPAIAGALAGDLKAPFLSRAEQNGGYLNFYIEKDFYAKTVVEAVLNAGGRYGAGQEGAGKTVCFDYSSINIAKPFHIGHLLTTVIGNSLVRIYQYLGYHTVSINHLGDWGTQFGKLIVAYRRWGDRAQIERNPMRELVAIYVRFHEEAEKDPSLDDEARAAFKSLEDGDAQAMALYNWFKEVTLREVGRVYDMLGITFDSYNGEAFYCDKMEPVVQELRDKHLLQLSEGAQIVDLEPYGMPPCLILRSDGATLYATRDIAAAFYRKKTYDFDKCLYVVAYQQTLHFKQWFKVVELMGYPWAKDLEHIAFGMVSLEDGAMSTRKGRVIYLEDVFKAAIEKAQAIMQEKSPDLPCMEDVAKDVGVGAVVFFALYNNRIKDVVFSWDRALNFDGETGPYVQYTHARCCSVLAKAGDAPQVSPDYGALADPFAQALISLLEKFPATVREAALRNEPSIVTRFTVDVAQAYNKFYYENHILVDDPAVRSARIALTRAAKSVIASGLDLIGLKAPERM